MKVITMKITLTTSNFLSIDKMFISFKYESTLLREYIYFEVLLKNYYKKNAKYKVIYDIMLE